MRLRRNSALRSTVLGISVFALAGLAPLHADTAAERLNTSADVLKAIMEAPDKGIPQNLLADAYCVVIVPNEKKLAFGIGAKYGRGFAICRRENHSGWGAPGAVRVEGASYGFQIGGSETDVVMLVMGVDGMNDLLQDKFTLSASAGVAAGPVGRHVSAKTDAQMSAKILTYSRSNGLFAGVALGGATLRNDLDANEEMYGRPLHNRQIVMENIKPPAAAERLLSELNQYSKRQGS